MIPPVDNSNLKIKNMKKVILTAIVFILLSCEISFKEASAAESNNNIICESHSCITYQERYINGYNYGIFHTTYASGGQAGDIFVINLTKEKLEIELLKKQLSE